MFKFKIKCWVFFFRIVFVMIQRNICKWFVLRNWQWWKLYVKVKLMLNVVCVEDEMKKKLEEMYKMEEEFKKIFEIKKKFEE